MTDLSPPPHLMARFRADLAQVAGESPSRLGVAVSGGPDSLALLLLACAVLPGGVEAATVDHGLRPESAAEAAGVAALCRRLGLPHVTLPVLVPDGPGGLQAEARRARYAALADWARARGLAAFATAHHADDQAETVLMRLRRGAGVAGLAGVRPARREGDRTVLRPLLGWTKAELGRIVAEAGVDPVDDPSNRDTRFDRTGIRALLAAHPELQPARLARSAAALREADDALEWVAARLWEERAGQTGGALTLDAAGLPAALRRRLLVRALAAFGGGPPRGEDLTRLLARLAAGDTATLVGVQCRGGALWRFQREKGRRG